MTGKSGKIPYYVRLDPDTVPALRDFAMELGFLVETKGRYHGDPSPGELIDAIAAFYLADPPAAAKAFAALGIVKSEAPE